MAATPGAGLPGLGTDLAARLPTAPVPAPLQNKRTVATAQSCSLVHRCRNGGARSCAGPRQLLVLNWRLVGATGDGCSHTGAEANFRDGPGLQRMEVRAVGVKDSRGPACHLLVFVASASARSGR